MDEQQFLKSTFYEQLVEHVFIAELLQEVWYRHHKTVEVLRSEIDASGFDLVLECDSVMRHVQLKTSQLNSRTAKQLVNLTLSQKPAGCVIWLVREEDRDSHRMKLQSLFFGGRPGEPLPSLDRFKIAKRTTRSSSGMKPDRPWVRVIPKRSFETLSGISPLIERLFGLGALEPISGNPDFSPARGH